ncbi:hypothetical protein PILCRDRAFT_1903 [Piloderma croceum F 1598]|uniref:Uncharacterized protein n=1 Tax=Piloderma croceum (strain F 1598) TaxID=765440 RepID=A0A0C3GCX8_PILCF|nr:hypothetical protein PILCRDRAFT_17163 [Piloderma croceum F 1598]KIM89554.1 hypothetical protein PILCRDRAFT_1903 [Piloderma croceum F 1598]
MAVKPDEDGNCSMKYMEIEFQGFSGIGSYWRLPYVLDKVADTRPCVIPLNEF